MTEPYAVQLAGEYDVWDQRNPDAAVFQLGLRSVELDTEWWDHLLNPTKHPDTSDTWSELTTRALLNNCLVRSAL